LREWFDVPGWTQPTIINPRINPKDRDTFFLFILLPSVHQNYWNDFIIEHIFMIKIHQR
jgi:hypothetical protein